MRIILYYVIRGVSILLNPNSKKPKPATHTSFHESPWPQKTDKNNMSMALWAIHLYCHCIHAITGEERETDLLVLSSYSSYSCCVDWAGKRPLRPFAAVQQRSLCHPERNWGVAGGDRHAKIRLNWDDVSCATRGCSPRLSLCAEAGFPETLSRVVLKIVCLKAVANKIRIKLLQFACSVQRMRMFSPCMLTGADTRPFTGGGGPLGAGGGRMVSLWRFIFSWFTLKTKRKKIQSYQANTWKKHLKCAHL